MYYNFVTNKNYINLCEENPDNPALIHNYNYNRLILDEGHELIKSKHKKSEKLIFEYLQTINATKKWIVSGTPYSNISDFNEIVKFLTNIEFSNFNLGDFEDSKYATGRRKTSLAKVWLKKGSGKIYVNGKLFNEYFSSEFHHLQITRPFDIINQSTDYDVRCRVSGGGPTGQAGALVHGISKALVMFDENFKTTLKTEKLTTRDSRAVERKKPGRRKARRSFQFSKR
jgi:small subunit ribosomal protein S9